MFLFGPRASSDGFDASVDEEMSYGRAGNLGSGPLAGTGKVGAVVAGRQIESMEGTAAFTVSPGIRCARVAEGATACRMRAIPIEYL